MGDRAYVSVEIRGPINTVEGLEAIVSAIEDDLQYGGEESVEAEILRAIDRKEHCARFEAEEVNYADISSIEIACKAHGIGFTAYNDAGCEYPAGIRAYHPGDAEVSECEGTNPAIPLDEVEGCMKGDEVVVPALLEIVQRYRRMQPRSFPKLAVSPEVLARLEAETEPAAEAVERLPDAASGTDEWTPPAA